MNPYRGEDDGNDGVSLKSIKPLREDAEKDDKSKINRAVSIVYKEIDTSYAAFEIFDEVKSHHAYIKDKIDAEISDDLSFKGQVKDENIAKLILLRKKIMRADPDWAFRRQSEVKDEINLERGEGSRSIAEMVATELNNGFFQLDLYTTDMATAMHSFTENNYYDDASANGDSDRPTNDDPLPDLANMHLNNDGHEDSIGIGDFDFSDF